MLAKNWRLCTQLSASACQICFHVALSSIVPAHFPNQILKLTKKKQSRGRRSNAFEMKRKGRVGGGGSGAESLKPSCRESRSCFEDLTVRLQSTSFCCVPHPDCLRLWVTWLSRRPPLLCRGSVSAPPATLSIKRKQAYEQNEKKA